MIDPRIPYFYKTWYRVPFLVPYWTRRDLGTILRASWTGANGGEAKSTEQLKRTLKQRFGFPAVVLTSSGRFAVEVALRGLNRPQGEVIIPTFICSSVAEAVLAAGHRPVLADVNDDLTLSADSVREGLTDKTVAVLVAHISGKPARDLFELIELCRERGIVLIDDAAQAFGVKFKGRYLGSYGDFGILSFGTGKPTFSIGGGALILNAAQDARFYEQQVKDHADSASKGQLASAWNYLLQYCWRRATLPLFSLGRLITKVMGFHSTLLPKGGMSELAAVLQLRQIEHIDTILAKFRDHSQRMINALQDNPNIVFPQRADGCGYTKLLVYLTNGNPKALAVHLLKNRIETEWSYTPLGMRSEYAAYGRRKNLTADRMAPHLLALPVHPGMSDRDTDLVVSAVKSFTDRENLS